MHSFLVLLWTVFLWIISYQIEALFCYLFVNTDQLQNIWRIERKSSNLLAMTNYILSHFLQYHEILKKYPFLISSQPVLDFTSHDGAFCVYQSKLWRVSSRSRKPRAGLSDLVKTLAVSLTECDIHNKRWTANDIIDVRSNDKFDMNKLWMHGASVPCFWAISRSIVEGFMTDCMHFSLRKLIFHNVHCVSGSVHKFWIYSLPTSGRISFHTKDMGWNRENSKFVESGNAGGWSSMSSTRNSGRILAYYACESSFLATNIFWS